MIRDPNILACPLCIHHPHMFHPFWSGHVGPLPGVQGSRCEWNGCVLAREDQKERGARIEREHSLSLFFWQKYDKPRLSPFKSLNSSSTTIWEALSESGRMGENVATRPNCTGTGSFSNTYSYIHPTNNDVIASLLFRSRICRTATSAHRG